MITLTTFDLDQNVFDSLKAGASGFLLKDTYPPGLLEAIRVVHEGNALLSPMVTRRLIAEFVSHTPAPQPTPRLESTSHRLAPEYGPK